MSRAVGDDRDDARAVGGVVVGGQQRRQVRAGAGDEDDEPTRLAGGRGGALGRLVRHAPTLPARARRCGRPSGAAPFVGENARVSNPYAPPEDRPRTPDDAPVRRRPAVLAAAPARRSRRPVVPERAAPADPEGTARADEPHAAVRACLVLASVLVGHAPAALAGCRPRRSRSPRSSSASARWSSPCRARVARARAHARRRAGHRPALVAAPDRRRWPLWRGAAGPSRSASTRADDRGEERLRGAVREGPRRPARPRSRTAAPGPEARQDAVAPHRRTQVRRDLGAQQRVAGQRDEQRPQRARPAPASSPTTPPCAPTSRQPVRADRRRSRA